jgi:hypothetical protein
MNTKKAFSILLMSMLIASALAIGVPKAKASPDAFAITEHGTLNTSLTFGPSGSLVGTHFKVDGYVDADHSRLYGVDLQVGYPISEINYVAHNKTIPTDGVPAWPTGILKKPTLNVKDNVAELGADMTGSAPGTMYWVSEAAMLPAPNFNGTGTAFVMEFVIMDQPGVSESVTFQIGITGSTLADDHGVPIAHTETNMTITLIGPTVILPPEPLLKVEHSDYYGVLNNNFDVNILLMDENHGDLDPKWDVAGFDFKLTYNATLIEPQAIAIDPAGWFVAFWPNGIFIVKQEWDDLTGLAWIVFLGIPGDNGTHTPPAGQGTIARVTFKAVYEQTPPPFAGPTCALDIVDSTIAGFPHPERPYGPWFGQETSVPIPHVVENGVYHAPVLFATGIDIYQYDLIGWGKGVNMPTDMLWPQKSMKVYAKVQYNLWPEQQKDVAFEVIDPHGNIWGIFYNRTDADGICWIFVRLPWPCDDPQYYFGVWTIFATVDIACHVYNDTMQFKYNYRVIVLKTTLDKVEYAHTEYIHVTIDYTTVATHTFDALFTATATDVTGVPFAFGAVGVQVVPAAVWCTNQTGSVSIDLYIPKFARAGAPATVWVGVMSDYPINGGETYYPTRRPETVVDFSILPS